MFSYLKNLFFSQTSTKSVKSLSGIKKTDALFHNLVTEQQVPGIAITILREGEALLQKGYGYADLEKKIFMNPKETIFRIASISKCITGLAFGKMVEEGLLNWDDSFYKHVPYYPKKKHDFTLRQLASHTAGIRGYRGKEFALNRPSSIKESIEVFKNDPLVFEPGRGYLYNSFDFVLLSLAMQEVSGVPFEAYVKENVLDPLGMIKTFAPECHPERSRRVFNTHFYTKTATGFKKAVEVNNFYKLAGGGYLSTSEDIAKLGQAILKKELLNLNTYQELLTAQKVNGKSIYYGLGFQVSQDANGRHFLGHVGNSVGAYTNFFVYPEQKTVVSILINSSDPKVQNILDGAINEILMNKFV
ncbi:serine hydrolase domain-containing protein [Allomuricauda sp. d1]|uniref:serine hydrolase domain-containing protein n=1 Tax=Allomuricauda sp. d1 TaxID=3136725 RepID=UPI0031E14134